jgi:peptide/nickel transport system permease protein
MLYVGYIGRRVVAALVVMFAVVTATFLLSHAIPATPARAVVGVHAGAAQVRAAKKQLGLDRPLWAQYFSYLAGVLHGNLGISYMSRTAIAPQLLAAVPATLELVLYSFVVCAVVGVIAGMVEAWRPRHLSTHVFRGGSMVGAALPVYWFAMILQLVFAARLGWFPITGQLSTGVNPPPHITGIYTLDALVTGHWGTFENAAWHLVLPVVSLVAWMLALTSRVSEKSFADELARPYVQTALARGAGTQRLLWRHVMRNALNPIITILGLEFGWLLGGTMLVEVVFSWPGIGSYMYQAIENFNYPVIVAVTLVITTGFVLVNLVVDLLYLVLDPRVRAR